MSYSRMSGANDEPVGRRGPARRVGEDDLPGQFSNMGLRSERRNNADDFDSQPRISRNDHRSFDEVGRNPPRGMDGDGVRGRGVGRDALRSAPHDRFEDGDRGEPRSRGYDNEGPGLLRPRPVPGRGGLTNGGPPRDEFRGPRRDFDVDPRGPAADFRDAPAVRRNERPNSYRAEGAFQDAPVREFDDRPRSNAPRPGYDRRPEPGSGRAYPDAYPEDRGRSVRRPAYEDRGRDDFADRGNSYRGRDDADFGYRGRQVAAYNRRPVDDEPSYRQNNRYDSRNDGFGSSGNGPSRSSRGAYDDRRPISPFGAQRSTDFQDAPRRGGGFHDGPARGGGFRDAPTRGSFHDDGPVRGRSGSYRGGRDDDFGNRFHDDRAPRSYRGRDRDDSYGDRSGFGHRDNFRSGFNDGNGFLSNEQARERAPPGYMPEEQSPIDIMETDRKFAQAYGGDMLDGDTDMVVVGVNDGSNTVLENWNDIDFHPNLLKNIKNSGYVRPRKVQRFAIPLIMENYDLKCQSETGSGKTAAFLIPIIQNLINTKMNECAPRCLVLCPTRELVKQIYDQAVKFAHGTGVTVAFAYGETSVRDNISKIKSGCAILCATLGRLTHFVDNMIVFLDDIEYLVIDEADRFMDHASEGFNEFLRMPALPAGDSRQTLLFSATLDTPEVESISRNFLRPKCATLRANAQTNRRLKYELFAVEASTKVKVDCVVSALHRLNQLNGDKIMRVLVFVNKKMHTDMVATRIAQAGFKSTTIHGDRGQNLREEALSDFKSGKKPILVATDVAARGVDIQNLDYVIQMDLPNNDFRCFVQRSGRCGRTHPGTAISFYCNDDMYIGDEIAKAMRQNNQEPPEFLSKSSLDFEDYALFTKWVGDAFPQRAPSAAPSVTRDSGFGATRSRSPTPAAQHASADDDWD